MLPGESQQWIGTAHIIGRDPIHKHLLITSSLLGLQIVWATEFAQAAPYLLTLGLSKSRTSLVFLAGPLAGLIVQPLIGSYSDNCRSTIGRRRPFIIGGGILCVLSLFLFGYAREIASIFTTRGSPTNASLTLWLAIISIYVLDFSINAVQAMDRAIMVDIVPASQQEDATAWASRMLGTGSLIGFFISGSDLTIPFGWISSSQIKLISLLAIITFIFTHSLTCYSVTERILLANQAGHSSSLTSTLKSIWSTFRTLPLPIWRVMQVQILSWLAMFAVMFYSSTWVAEIYLEQYSNGQDLADATEELATAATRAGSRALLYQSLVIVTTSIIVPFLVSAPGNSATRSPPGERVRWADADGEGGLLTRLLVIVDLAQDVIASRMPTLPLPWLSLPMAWAIAEGVFSLLMFCTWFVSGVVGASIIVALTGITMAMSMWAPFSLVRLPLFASLSIDYEQLGEFILEQPGHGQGSHYETAMPMMALPLSPIPEEDEEELRSRSTSPNASSHALAKTLSNGYSHYNQPPPSAEGDKSSFDETSHVPRVLQLRHSDSFETDLDSPPSPTEEFASRPSTGDVEKVSAPEATADAAGTILGLHNICIVVPQLITTFLSSIVFAIMAPGADTGMARGKSSDALGLILRAGGVATCFAAYVCWKLSKEADRRYNDQFHPT